MVQWVRDGLSLRMVALRFHVALRTVQRWVLRAKGQRLDRVDWTDHSCKPRRTRRVSPAIEKHVLHARKQLQQSALGEVGALAIHQLLQKQEGVERGLPPSVRTINRILRRHGVLDGRTRTRRPPPPRGWYLPNLWEKTAELDAFDVVEGLILPNGDEVQVLNAMSLHGHVAASWPRFSIVAANTLDALLEHWRAVGLPDYVQFDNDTRFQGPHNFPDTLGRVIRLCLALQVVPVFVPPRETGFQAAIESFNGLWQKKVWLRFLPDSLAALQKHSRNYIDASRTKHATRMPTAPVRRAFPKAWKLDYQADPKGHMVYLRRTDDQGRLEILGHSFLADSNWVHRLVRADIDFQAQKIRMFALRRSQPKEQPLLSEHAYIFPKRLFRETSSRASE
jgi:hypothetical protein